MKLAGVSPPLATATENERGPGSGLLAPGPQPPGAPLQVTVYWKVPVPSAMTIVPSAMKPVDTLLIVIAGLPVMLKPSEGPALAAMNSLGEFRVSVMFTVFPLLPWTTLIVLKMVLPVPQPAEPS